MDAKLAINIEQLKMLINQFPVEEKIELIRFLEKQTFEIRFPRLLNRLRTTDISLDEITREVEIARQKRYQRSD